MANTCPVSSFDRLVAQDELALAGVAPDVAVARGLARDFLTRHGISAVEGPGYAAVTVVSELVTNAVVHGTGPLTLRVGLDDGRIEVVVEDHSLQVPRQRDPDIDAVDGRGLQVVASLCDSWESTPTGNGKRVTAQ